MLRTLTFTLLLGLTAGDPTDPTPFAVPTFHCLGLYWSPPGGAADKPV